MTYFVPPLLRRIHLLCGLGKNRKRNQMKQMKTSERKHTQLSTILHLFFLCACLCVSCNESHENLNFKTTGEALEIYRAEMEKIKTLDIRNASQLSAVVNEWKSLSDTVFNFIQKDPSYNAHVGLSLEFMEITDSIKSQIENVGDKKNWTLKDLAVLKLNTAMSHSSKTFMASVQEAAAFYMSLDSIEKLDCVDTNTFMNKYVTFLEQYSEFNFSSEKDLQLFLTNEDRYFTFFLDNLNIVLANDMTEITHYTEMICKNIFKAANEDRIKDESVLAYMAMRTNRRVLENANICSRLIDNNNIANPELANTYLWMIIQPFLVIDNLSISVLTEQQKVFFVSLAENYSRLVAILAKNGLTELSLTDSLPTRMFKLYLTTL